MRELKFRALSSGKWWYSDDEAYVLKDDNGILKLYEDESFYNNKKRELLEIGMAYQFTGLHDCKGAEIYDGEILTGRNLIYKVLWDELWGWRAWYDDGSKTGNDGALWLITDKSEVIGNIHQHPDLIRKD